MVLNRASYSDTHSGREVRAPSLAPRPPSERILSDLHLADLRHEGASRFDEAGMAISFVSAMLGHTNLTTTSRYLNVHRRGLHMAMQKYEEARRLAISCKDTPAADAEPPSRPNDAPASKSLVS